MIDLESAVATLADLQVGFYVRHDCHGGQRTVHLDAHRVVAYASNPIAYLAAHYGVTPQEYIGWHVSGYAVRCAAKTKRGRPCRGTVPGLTCIADPKVWADNQGGYCARHTEGS